MRKLGKQGLKLVGLLLGLVLLFVSAAALYLNSLDFNEYKALFQDAVKQATGRTLDIDGRMELKLSLHPSLSVSGLHLANAGWGSRRSMADIGRLDVEVRLLPLLSGQLVVNRLVLVQPDILLETGRAGIGNWVFGEQGAVAVPENREGTGSTFLLPQFRHLLLRDARLTYRDGQSGEQRRLELPEVEVRSRGKDADAALALHASVLYGGKAVQLEGGIGSLSALAENRELTIELKASLAASHLKLDGSVVRPLDARGIHLNIALESPDVARLAAGSGIRFADKLPLHLRAALQDDESGLVLKHVRMRLGESDAAGDIHIRLDGGKPLIKAMLASDKLDAGPWLAGDGATADKDDTQTTGEGAPEQRLFSSEPLPLDYLKALNAQVGWKVKQLHIPSARLTRLDMRLHLEDGQLRIAPLSMQLAGGSIQGSIGLNARKPSVLLDAVVTGKGIVAGKLLGSGGEAGLVEGGPVDINVMLKGSGKSVAGLMAHLNGRIKLSMGKASVKSTSLNLIGGDLLLSAFDKLNPFSDKPDYTELACGVVHFRIKDGLMQSEDGIAFETARMNILSGGEINLKNETVDLSIATEPREGLGLNLSNMVNVVRLGGTLAAPSLAVDAAKSGMVAARAAGAVVTGGLSLLGEGLFNRVMADKTPCQTALDMK